jgi:Fur family transcriptional regulator, ferric uptake regulator
MKEANNVHEHSPREVRVGKRMTKVRREIIEILKKAPMPLSMAELIEKVTANEASVYRTVALLEEKGQLHEIHFPDGTHRFELASQHHHHAICRSCGFTEHMSCTEPIPVMRSPHFGTFDDHVVTYGLCIKCV